MRTKKVPLRKCVACQLMFPKKELIRVVRTPEDSMLVDVTGKKSGRGAYVCGKVACFQLAQKSRAFDRAFKRPVSPELYAELEQQFIRVEPAFQAMKLAVSDHDE